MHDQMISLIQQTPPKGYMVKYVRFNTFNLILNIR